MSVAKQSLDVLSNYHAFASGQVARPVLEALARLFRPGKDYRPLGILVVQRELLLVVLSTSFLSRTFRLSASQEH